MATLPRIFGDVRIPFPQTSLSPLGLTIEFTYTSASAPNGKTWLGAAVIDAGGLFELFPITAVEAGTSITYSIYKGTQLLQQAAVPMSNTALHISLDVNNYDVKAIDDSRLDETVNYTVIRGQVTLGAESIPAIPVDKAQVIVTARKALFGLARTQTGNQRWTDSELVKTTLDPDGKYELKIPYRLLYPASSYSPPISAIPNILIDIMFAGKVIATSDYIQVTETRLEQDLHIGKRDDFPSFLPNYDYVAGRIQRLTSLDPASFYTITKEGPLAELDAVISSSGLQGSSVLNAVDASMIGNAAGIPLQHAYALVRSQENNSLEGLSALDEETIIGILATAEANLIIGRGIGDANETADKLSASKVGIVSADETEDGDSLGRLLQAVLGDTVKVNLFLKMNLEQSELPLDTFWANVKRDLGAESTSRLQRGIQLLGITGMQPEMTTALLNTVAEGKVGEVLTDMNETQWYNYIDAVCQANKKLCIPISIRGEITDVGNRAVKEAYAAKLNDLTTDLFATVTARKRLIADEKFAKCFSRPQEVISFLQANSDYDLRVDNAWNALPESSTEALKKDLLPLQNLTRLLGGKPDVVVQLMKDGIRSSSQIAAMQEVDFVKQYSALLKSDTLTAQLYTKAVHTDMLLKQSYLQVMPGSYVDKVTMDFNRDIWFIDNKQTSPPSKSTTPDLKTLFGNMDFCACSDCTSMYSPAAYFTDILNFLKTRFSSTAAYEELTIRRRPDLIHIDLSCKNSNTPLPYIDLVNELLELIILRNISATPGPDKGMFVPLSFQTSGTAKELEAYPEHTYKYAVGVYKEYRDYTKVYDDRLKTAVYPNILPFDLALEESRIYFKHLGFSRHDLMDSYKPKNYLLLFDFDLISDYNIVAERLGVSRVAADIITKNVGNDAAQYYGLEPTTAWYDVLCNDLEGLLKRCNITYKELLQLLETDFLNKETGTPAQRPFAVVAKPGKPQDTCHVDELMLELRLPLSSPSSGTPEKIALFDKLHRFVRLQRATGWSIYQLDIVLTSLGTNDITPDVFRQVGKAYLWCEQFSLPPEKVCVFWSTISIRNYTNFDSDTQDPLPSLYDTLFRNKAILNPPDPNFKELGVIVGSYAQNSGTIMAAFNIKEDELAFFVGDGSSATSLEALSYIYKFFLISRGLGFISFKEFQHSITLWQYTFGIGTPADIDGLAAFFAQVRQQKDQVFSTDELSYLLCHEDNNSILKPANDIIRPFYENLRLELLNQYDTTNSTANADLLQHVVIELFAAAFGINTQLSAYLLKEVVKAGTASQPILEKLTAADFIQSTAGITPTNGIPGLPFGDLYKAYYQLGKIALIVSRLRLSPEEVAVLQEKHTALNVLDLSALPTAAGLGSQALTNSLFLLKDWIKVRDSFNLKRTEFTDVLLYSVGQNADGYSVGKDDWLTLVQKLSQWNRIDLEYLLGDSLALNTGILKYSYQPGTPASNDYKSASLLLQLKSIMDASYRTGVNVINTFNALRPVITVPQSQLIRKAAKAKYNDDAWLKIAKPLQDQLREKQRKALVAYILANPGMVTGNTGELKNENALFAFLLIDVEMQPCMKTSRIKQGISSLQLFIDRIVLSLERVGGGNGALITMSEALLQQWHTWRKWYRVWEANRKVFLYPENWIEPELRDNKTQLFKDLETQLLQDEITGARVEAAYRSYLEGLDEVARLEPVTAYHEVSPGRDIVHVFSRTDVYPQRYYYRRLQDNEWSPWERINVDIKSDHVVPVMKNDRLYLFWLSFQSKRPADGKLQEELADDQRGFYKPNSWIDMLNYRGTNGGSGRLMEDKGNDRYNQWDITLNWTSYLDSKWQKSDMCRDVMNIDMSKVQINNAARQSYNNTSYAQSVLQVLTKRGEVKIDELFKNRIYLFAPFSDLNIDNDSITFNLVFPGGLNECGVGLHCFVWKGGNSRDAYVVRDSDAGHQIAAPAGTRFNKMKFEEDPTQDGKLKLDSYGAARDGYYAYSVDYYFQNLNMKLRSSSQTMLNNTPWGRFRLTAKNAVSGIGGFNPLSNDFFFEDDRHTFFIQKASTAQVAVKNTAILKPERVSLAKGIDYAFKGYNLDIKQYNNAKQGALYLSPVTNTYSTDNYRFYTFYHAQVPTLISALNKGGIPAMLTIGNQSRPDTIQFGTNYQPTALVNASYPKDTMQFDFSDPYSIYNWELFFHAPMLIAQGLSNNQQFEEAQKWYHYIFNPTSNTDMNGNPNATNQRFWKFYPFYVESATPAQTLSQLIIAINNNVSAAVAQVRKWEQNPFNPHIIARMRILAYMKNVLMKYLDNLIAWADQLFRRDTIESINEATQLYILAANILGDRPMKIPPRVKKDIKTFFELLEKGPLDAFSNAMVAIESFYTPNAASGGGYKGPGKDGRDGMALYTLYFCLPPNDKLLAYWDTIADRLFKIRNCMNIDGTVRQLPLYEPPIDPALLVRATAMGVNINTVLDNENGVNAPNYRFTYMLQKANELVADVKGLGSALLSAIEKKDGEALALLRSTHEIQLLERVKFVKELQVNDASTALEALRRTRENTQIRLTYYTTRPFKNSNEEEHLSRLGSAKDWGIAQGVLETTAGIMSMIPTAHAQLMASGVSFGGLQLANVMRAASSAIGIKVGIDNIKGSMAVTTGGYERRRDDWVFQANTASKELQQLDQQILGAEIRLNIANKELANHELQIDNTREVDAYMRSKFSNVELYNWMIAQISATYFQTYQLAYDMAKRTELCYTYELPKAYYPSTGFIKFGYWDSLRKGLMSGEKLQFDLRKMEATYMEENKRELELTKNISLALFSPEKLLDLKEKGTCELELPEALFDLDYAGHYLRRIKSVSISIPCIAGPYTTINCELTQLNSKYRKDTLKNGTGPNGAYAEYQDPWDDLDSDSNPNPNPNPGPGTDKRFVYSYIKTAIATSTAQNDSGVFELNFRDERYLPFEGTGAISRWRLSFPSKFRQFDYEKISDVIFHIKYTAKADGSLKAPATDYLQRIFETLKNKVLFRYFSLKHEYSNEWFAYQNAKDQGIQGAKLDLVLRPDDFPYFCKGKKIQITGWYLRMNPKRANLSMVVNAPDLGINNIQLKGAAGVPIELLSSQYITVGNNGVPISMDLTLTCDYKMADLDDFYWVARYELSDLAEEAFSDCGRSVLLKDFSGNNVAGYPAGVFDRNGKYIGMADSKEKYAQLWNNAAANIGFAKIFTTSGETNFNLLGDPAHTITDLRAMHAFQFDFSGSTVLDSISAPENGYIDFGDGTVIFTKHGATLPANTLLYRTNAPNVPIGLYITGTGKFDRTFQIQNYSESYQHTYTDASHRVVSVMFNMDSDYLLDTDNRDGTPLYTYVSNLRGFLPKKTRSLEFTSTQSASFNTLSGIKNMPEVLPNLIRLSLRSGADNTIPANVNFGTWDFPYIQCLDFGTFFSNQSWTYAPRLIKDQIGTTNLPAKYPALHSIGFMGNQYSNDLNLAIPNIRWAQFGSGESVPGNRLPAGATDRILIQLDSVKTDTGGTLRIAGEQPTTPNGIAALQSLQNKGMTVTFI